MRVILKFVRFRGLLPVLVTMTTDGRSRRGVYLVGGLLVVMATLYLLQILMTSSGGARQVIRTFSLMDQLISRSHNTGITVQTAENCLHLHFSEEPLPSVALASFPGSGNTWVRHLIQQTTGIYTGSIYGDALLQTDDFPGARVTNTSVIVIKTHKCYDAPYNKTILIVRNPYDSIKAEFNRQKAGKTGRIKNSDYQRKGFTRFVSRQVEEYRRFNLCWLQSRKTLHIVHYEKLKIDLKLELRKILRFLNRPISEKTLDCVEHSTGEKWHRKKSDFDPYLGMDVNVLKKLEDVQRIVDNEAKERMKN